MKIYDISKQCIGTGCKPAPAGDDDIMATIYHEYMHYLRWHNVGQYRMDNVEKGYVYSKRDTCYEERTGLICKR